MRDEHHKNERIFLDPRVRATARPQALTETGKWTAAALLALALLAMFALSACGPAPQASLQHVSYGMRAVLDGEALPPLVTITAASCFDGYGGYTLSFSGVADRVPEAIDDEIVLVLTVQIDDIEGLPPGRAVPVAGSTFLRLAADTAEFLPNTQGQLTAASGTLTLTAISYGEMSGSALLSFADPGDANPAVQNSLDLEVVFTNLAITRYCPEEVE